MKGPTPSAFQRRDGLWVATLDKDMMAATFTTEDAAILAARQRLHSWWHRADAMVTTETAMTTCEECNDQGEPA